MYSTARVFAALAALLPGAPALADISPLPLDAITTTRLTGPHVDHTFAATEPGILTVAVRMPMPAEMNDLYILVAPEAFAAQLDEIDMMSFGFEPGPIEIADDDRHGEWTSEQIAATIPAPGTYVVRIQADEPDDIVFRAQFMPFAPAARAPVELPDPVLLRPDKPRMADIEAGAAAVFELTAPEDGTLTVITRGAGDVSMSVTVSDHQDVRSRLTSDNDQDESGANESLAVDVKADQHVLIRLDAYSASRVVVLARLAAPPDEAFRAMEREAAMGPPHALVGAMLPEIALTDADGNAVRLEEIEADVLVLDLWAMWCPPCIRALPEVQQVHAWAQSSNLPVAVRTINIGEAPDDVRPFLDRMGISLPVLYDRAGAAYEKFETDAIPTTVIVVHGEVEVVLVGLQPDHGRKIREIVEGFLDY